MLYLARLSKTKRKHFPPLFKPTSTTLTSKCKNQINQTRHYTNHQISNLGSQRQAQIFLKHPFHDHFVFLLGSSKSLEETRKIQAVLTVSGFLLPDSDVELVGPQLVNTYVTLGSLQDAFAIFYHLPKKNVFAWNSILRGLVNVGQFCETIEHYHFMVGEGLVPDNFTYPLVLKACSALSDLDQGKKIKELINYFDSNYGRKPNIFVECALIDMFAKCGSLTEALQVFDGMTHRDLVSWTAMICGTVQHGDWYEALDLFRRMRLDGFSADSVIVATVLPACGRLGALKQGMGLHGYSVRSGFENDVCVSNAAMDMYCKCGYTDSACVMFFNMEFKDVISWSSLIAGHLLNDEYDESLNLFVEMIASNVRPSPVTIASVLPGFSNLKLFKQGKEIHSYVIRRSYELDGFVASALVDMYAKCGSIKEAELIFEIALDKDIGVWNSMIVGYATVDDADSVFNTLRRIHKSKFRPNSITIMSVLPVCTQLTTLKQGREIHGYVTRSGFSSAVSVQNSIIDMYCKCGSLELGVKVFERLVEKDIVTYNTIIAALGMHGHGMQASSFFTQMRKERFKPDKVTFIALLSACSHAGLTDMGRLFFKSMIEEYGVVPEMEHYSCMVDLLGRSGCLDEAWEFIKKMPVDAGVDVLGSLLGACRIHKRIELAELVGKRIFDIDPTDPGYYVLLSNIYAAAGRSADVLMVRNMIKEKGLVKKPGNSWIQVGCCVHLFMARDRSHKQINETLMNLKSLLLQIKDEGYVPDLSFSLHELGSEDAELYYIT